jgi:F0F1-type ATP synthase delta subunit
MSKRTDLAGVIAKMSLAKDFSSRQVKEIAAYILDNRLSSQIDSLMRDVQFAWAEAGRLEVLVSSAHPLTNENRSMIKNQVKQVEPSAKTIVINEINDPSAIAGLRINLPGRQLDLSIEAKLNKFKQLVQK